MAKVNGVPGQLILEATLEALKAVTHPRFFQSERGYQGRFYCALQEALDRHGILQDGLILEMEYQKGARHGLTQRPDIVLHIPAEETEASVQENNVAVFALKRQASPRKARDDFQKLDDMCEKLDYPLAVFINLDSFETHMQHYGGHFHERLHVFVVKLEAGRVQIKHASWQDGLIIETTA